MQIDVMSLQLRERLKEQADAGNTLLAREPGVGSGAYLGKLLFDLKQQ